MKYFIDKGIVLSRTPEGPLALHIGPFAASLREQGYAMVSIHRQVLLAACFSRWLQKRAVSLRSITSDHPARYLRYRMRKVQRGRGDTAALGHLLAFLRSERVIPAEKIPTRRLTSVERCLQAYEHYLRETRGLAKATIINYVPFIRSFLEDCSMTDPSRCHISVPATSWDLYSVRRPVCTRSGRSSSPVAALFPAVCVLSRQD